MMPSFSSLVRARKSSQIDDQERKELGGNVDGDSGKLQRRSTKREFFKNLLKRSSTLSKSNRPNGQFVVCALSSLFSRSNSKPHIA